MWPHKTKLLLAAGLVLFASIRSPGGPLAPGDSFPVLNEFALEGNLPVTHQRVLVVDFWASWCPPCKASFPALSRLQAEYADQGVVVLGVSVDRASDQYAAFLKKFAPTFSVVRDHTQKLASLVQVPAIPTTYVLGRDGKIREIITGYHGAATDQAVRSAIKTILTEKSSP